MSKPTDLPTEQDLREAKESADSADRIATRAEAFAAKARRHAAARERHYQDLLLIAQGQIPLDLEEGK